MGAIRRKDEKIIPTVETNVQKVRNYRLQQSPDITQFAYR
jgi:hypothetical protein